jgi:acetyl esterase/lipase
MTEAIELLGQGVTILRDVAYGEASIGHGSTTPGRRTLRMDVYLPADDGTATPRPALMLSHGGAYHRGSKETDEFEQDGSHNTPMPEYCARYAAKGHVCFSIGYRLTQELPAPQPAPIRRGRTVHRGRIDHVRGLLGLPTATDAELVDGMEAAMADVACAFRFVEAHAARWRIDPSRIALGGFSAGAFSSIYAACALGVPAAAILSMSGGMDPEDAAHYLHGGRGLPPLLLFSSEFDLPGIRDRTLALSNRAQALGMRQCRYFVPGKPHFYDRQTAVVLEHSSQAASPAHCTLEAAMDDFLRVNLAAPAVDVQMLDAFAQAWCRHDVEALMAHMAEDCVFHTSAGPEASGTRHVGREAVRAAFAKAWADVPDAQWTRARHFVSGHRGVSEWTFTGTRASDGARIEVDGCDVFTFSGDKIRVKDSWRKQRG